MFLCIKAETKTQALEAAQSHKLDRVFLAKRVNHREISLEFPQATSAERLAIVKWFCSENGPAPYPNGTLLFYSESAHTGEIAIDARDNETYIETIGRD